MNANSPVAAMESKSLIRPENSVSPASSVQSVDFQSFLQLLTAQLRNQDPLSPLQSTEFVAQLASFSTVEQLVKANARLDAIAGGASNHLQTLSAWIGLEAGVAGAPAAFDGAPVEFRLTPNRGADRVEVVISDSRGDEAARFLGANSSESQYWDGSTPNGAAAPGLYTIEAAYFSGGREIERAGVATFSRIVEVSSSRGETTIGMASGVAIAPEAISVLRAP